MSKATEGAEGSQRQQRALHPRIVCFVAAAMILTGCGRDERNASEAASRGAAPMPTATFLPLPAVASPATDVPAAPVPPLPTDTPTTVPLVPTNAPSPAPPVPTDSPAPAEIVEPAIGDAASASAPSAPAENLAPPPTMEPPAVEASITTRAGACSELGIDSVDKDAEQVVIRNRTIAPITLDNWILRSERGNQDCYLKGSIEPGATLVVNAQNGDAGALNCGFDANIWNNSESDPAVLINPQGVEVCRYE